MEDKKLGKLISYLDNVARSYCKELICCHNDDDTVVSAGTLLETIDYFKTGDKPVKLECETQDLSPNFAGSNPLRTAFMYRFTKERRAL